MLDLAFLRTHLQLVEDKLRQRGADPSLLSGFRVLDEQRRSAITEVESLKGGARRRRRSQDSRAAGFPAQPSAG